MNSLFELLSAQPGIVPTVIAVLALAGLISVILRGHQVKAQLRRSPEEMAGWDPLATEPAQEPETCSFTRQYLLGLPAVEIPGTGEKRLLVSQDIESIFDRYVEHRTASARFSFGPLATGAALFCTFILIAHVLQTDIYNAVGGAGSNAAGSSASLANAVRTLGAKFYISAVGILASVIFAGTVPLVRKQMFEAAHEAARKVGPKFCTPATLAASTQLALLGEGRLREQQRATEMATLTAGLQEVRDVLIGTRTDLEKLKSIEVSVKDIGMELKTELRQMLKDDLGVEIKGIMQEVLSRAESMSEQLQERLLKGFEHTLQRELPRILESLDAIKKSVEGQAESPIERLLEQLQGVVSGGMRGESAQLSAAIKQFADVVPALADQLRATADNLTQDMESRTKESSRANEALITQVGSLLGKLESQQQATERLITDIGQAAASSAETLVRRVQSESNEVFDKLLKTSREDVTEMLSALRNASKASVGNYEELERSVTATSKAILEARDGLQTSADAIRALSAESRAVISDARSAHEVAGKASGEFDRSAVRLREGVESMRAAVDGAREHAAEQSQLLAEHRRQLAELEAVWPKLFEGYISNFDAKSRQLLQGWDDFMKKTGAFSQTVGGQLAEAAEELSSAVDRLATLQAGKRA